ncbi:MAG: ABC transporter permease [Chloroflexi bacterium]|nr:ABC transporter permease [Chloroflexota bacterium]
MSPTPTAVAGRWAGRHPRRRADVWKTFHLFLQRKPLGGVGAILVVLLFAVAALSPVLAPADPLAASGKDFLAPPSARHLMGADDQGRDVLSRVLWGARISLYAATLAVGVTVVVAAVLGVTSGYVGGAFDAVVQRVVDAVMSFPFLILVVTILMLTGNTVTNVGLAIGLVSGVSNSRVIRSSVLSLRQHQFIEAARAIGCSSVRIMALHLLPNTFAPLIVIGTLIWGNAILLESAVSFLGFGVPPPNPSWGLMISGPARTYLETAPWMAFFPGVAISLSVFGFNMLGDALRDVLDPRLRVG